MKFIQLLKEVLRLSLSKYLFLFFILTIILTGCQKKDTDLTPVTIKPFFKNYDSLLNEVKILLHADDGIVLLGNFRGDTTQLAVAVINVNRKDEKINFNLIEIKDNRLKKEDETKPVDGSLKQCKVEKIRLPGFANDFFSYNSQIYFMGSNSGEVFAYLIDFKTQKTYFAHLISEPRRPEYLFISETDNPEIRKYFIDSFRKDYPEFKISSKDRVLN
jgi:hypothetical protein